MKILFLIQIIRLEEQSNTSKLLESANLYWLIAIIISIITIALNIYLFSKKLKSK